ncbi:MAG: penicillin-insensitive murein endopeptidase [Actinomycetota bacterium]|nr:penicillin-insensitive murein endopeptidase [Actinomycetota bacterium]
MTRTRLLAIVATVATLGAAGVAIRSTLSAPSRLAVVQFRTDAPLGAEGWGSRPSRRPSERSRKPEWPRVDWRESTAHGVPAAGSLSGGVLLPREGPHHFTWDPIKRVSPSPAWRRWGTDDVVRTVLGVLRGFARAHPGAARLGIGDLSLKHGGNFGAEVGGGIGHATHQNGLDADIYYPLRSKAERPPETVGEVDLRLAQDLVDRFVRAGAVTVYVGPNTPLTGPRGVVVPLIHHDNHLHVRIAAD